MNITSNLSLTHYDISVKYYQDVLQVAWNEVIISEFGSLKTIKETRKSQKGVPKGKITLLWNWNLFNYKIEKDKTYSMEQNNSEFGM